MNKITEKDELELMAIQNGDKEEVKIPNTNKSYKIGYMKGYTHEKLSLLELKDGMKEADETKDVVVGRTRLLAKAASYIILNGSKIFFFHWIFWRYLYYIKGYTYEQLAPIVETAKKKVTAVSWYKSTILLRQMKITNMTMTKKEQEQLQAELSSELEEA